MTATMISPPTPPAPVQSPSPPDPWRATAAMLRRSLPAVLGVVSVLALFQILPFTALVSREVFPTVTSDAAALAAASTTSGFWIAIGQTLLGWAISLTLAAVIAVPMGVLIGAIEPLDWATRRVIDFLRPIPSVSLIPLSVLVFGIGFESKIFLATFAAVWPILIHTIAGVRSTDPVALDTGRSFGFTLAGRLRYIVLPSALPGTATGVRVSAAIALVLVITAEIVVGAPGLGREIAIAQQSAAYALMYGLVFVSGLLGWIANIGMERAERRVLRWHTTYRSDGAS